MASLTDKERTFVEISLKQLKATMSLCEAVHRMQFAKTTESEREIQIAINDASERVAESLKLVEELVA